MRIRIPPRATKDGGWCPFIQGMTFDQRQWVSDIAVGTIAGLMTGAVAALYAGDPPFGSTLGLGGRGSGASTSLPRLAYVVFFVYVVAAAELAIVIRRRLSH